MPNSTLLDFDLRHLETVGQIIGIDEAGRGALAGPVVAAAVALEESFYHSLWCRQRSGLINDSKQLSSAKREALYTQMTQLKERGEIAFAVGVSSVVEIERLNILGATRLAMQRALESLETTIGQGVLERIENTQTPLFTAPVHTPSFDGVARVLVDGLPLKNFPFRHQAIIQGDAQSLSIAMASIIAKVTRDRFMDGLDIRLPLYGFAQHRGYATAAHRQAIRDIGASTEHRPTFLRKLKAGEFHPVDFVFSSQDKVS